MNDQFFKIYHLLLCRMWRLACVDRASSRLLLWGRSGKGGGGRCHLVITSKIVIECRNLTITRNGHIGLISWPRHSTGDCRFTEYGDGACLCLGHSRFRGRSHKLTCNWFHRRSNVGCGCADRSGGWRGFAGKSNHLSRVSTWQRSCFDFAVGGGGATTSAEGAGCTALVEMEVYFALIISKRLNNNIEGRN